MRRSDFCLYDDLLSKDWEIQHFRLHDPTPRACEVEAQTNMWGEIVDVESIQLYPQNSGCYLLNSKTFLG